MTIQAVSASTTSTGPSSAGNSVASGAASFEDMLQSSQDDAPPLTRAEARQRDQAHLVKRIGEVGLAQAMKEEHDKLKMMRVLTLFEGQASPDVRDFLRKIGDDFQRNPPDGLEDMYGRIQSAINKLPQGHLRDRITEAFKRIKELMALPDDKFRQLEKAAGLA